ncbi:MAG: hypothetical protein ABI459_09020 [Deltaproteobacteria bacterium]
MLAPIAGTALLATVLAGSVMLVMRQQSVESVPPVPLSTTTPENVSATTINMPARRPDLYYQAIADRPLFSPTRRPFEPDVVLTGAAEPDPKMTATPVTEPAAQPAEPPPDFRLLGLMTTAKGGRALIAVGDTAATWFGDGENLMGWRIGAVTRNGLTLTKDKIVINLEIYPQ